MGETLEIGRRIELVSMDLHYRDISIALYLQEGKEGPAYLVHTYSSLEGVQKRLEFAKEAMQELGGLEATGDGLLRFPCGEAHEVPIKRLFIEACKIDPSETAEARPMQIFDKKAGCNVMVTSPEKGVYEVKAEGVGERVDKRVELITGGLIKLGAMEDRRVDQVAFSCGHRHDSLVGLLLIRAPNVRAVIREQEAAASRGILAAPSQQK